DACRVPHDLVKARDNQLPRSRARLALAPHRLRGVEGLEPVAERVEGGGRLLWTCRRSRLIEHLSEAVTHCPLGVLPVVGRAPDASDVVHEEVRYPARSALVCCESGQFRGGDFALFERFVAGDAMCLVVPRDRT